MKKIVWLLFIFVFGIYLSETMATPKKLAQTGFQFLSIPTEARASAMGEAFITVAGNASSIFYNPANMSRTTSFVDGVVSQNKWIADINHYSGALVFNPFRGNYGTFGFSFLSVDYGDFLGTMVDPTTDKGFKDTGNFAPTSFAVGFGYARALTDRFSIGGHVKYARQQLGSNLIPVGDVKDGATAEIKNDVDVWAFDFGTLYQTAFKSLVFGMSVRNFSKEIKYQNEGFQLPLAFTLGISMDVFDFFMAPNSDHSLLVSIDAIHPRDYSERVNVGAEYTFMDILALRAGYMYNYDERDVTIGLGVQKFFGNHGIGLDYAYTPFGIFNEVQRMSFRFYF
ncbi:PorV/PorQ family protein [candidate division KSB1 bacterium]|nr:PorV/PorQ family protein [candidate division KSB1 bacterium]